MISFDLFLCRDFLLDEAFKSFIEQNIQFHLQASSSHQSLLLPFCKEEESTNTNEKNSNKTSSQTSLITNPIRKLEGRYRYVNVSLIPKLRIVKRDIRRRYIEMYNNVMNIHDISLLSGFLQEFCIPNCRYQINLPYSPQPVLKNGIFEILHHAIENQVTMPDGINLFGEAKIHVALERPGSRIISNATFKGTKIFDYLPSDKIAKFEQDSNETKGSDETKSTDSQQPEVSHSLLPIPDIHLSRSSHPVEVVFKGVLTLFLDDNNRIELFQVDDVYLSTKEVQSIDKEVPRIE